MATLENLKKAFIGESQTKNRYEVFAEIAEREGKEEISQLFRSIAKEEEEHAKSHLRRILELERISTVQDCLKTASVGEADEYEHIYPAYIEEAKTEGDEKATKSFEVANEAEKRHHQKLKESLEKIKREENV